MNVDVIGEIDAVITTECIDLSTVFHCDLYHEYEYEQEYEMFDEQYSFSDIADAIDDIVLENI